MQHFESSLGQDRRCGQEALKILKKPLQDRRCGPGAKNICENSYRTAGVDQELKNLQKQCEIHWVWTRSLKIHGNSA
jgi:hypothetical protein